MPMKLNIQLTLYVNEEKFKNVKFMQKKSLSFISWITSLLKPLNYNNGNYVYKEEEEITAIYFLMAATKCSFVLPKFGNKPYIDIEKGDQFGLIDIFACSKEYEFDILEFQSNKQHLKRYFTVMAIENVETLCLGLEDIIKIK